MIFDDGQQAEDAERSRFVRWATELRCTRSAARAPLDEPQFLSPEGAPWWVEYDLDPGKGAALRERLAARPWTLWRYRELLPIADAASVVSLGEGGTPLVPLRRSAPDGVPVWFKEEGGNPTGSFKARGLTLAVNRARELGAPGVELASAGNAALALTAYASACGLPSRVALPEDTPRTVFERCRAHGAEVLSGKGTLVEAGARLAEFDDGYWNLSTLREPYRIEGKKTMGLELAEQLDWRLPEWIVYPTGGGTGLIGMVKAFDELERLGLIDSHRPRMVAVQMAGCAPIVQAYVDGLEAAEPWPDPVTKVWGLRVPKALGDFLILRGIRESGGTAVAIEESAWQAEADRLASDEGLLVGSEGAAVMIAIRQLVASGTIAPGERVVGFQTGHPANYL